MGYGSCFWLLLQMALLVIRQQPVGSQPLGPGSRVCTTIHITGGDYHLQRNLTRLRLEYAASVAGCQYIHGDVVIQNVGADPVTEAPVDAAIRTLSTDFLDSIVEISGRLLIKRVNLEAISLRNLRAIRGYNPERLEPFYAIEVVQSRYPTRLLLPRLSAIRHGDVRIIGHLHASLYCFLSRRIDWPGLFETASQRFIDDVSEVTLAAGGTLQVSDFTAVETACGAEAACDASCHAEMTSGRRLCWSSGPQGCQMYHGCSRRLCANCFLNPHTRDEECCHPSCLGGCISENPDGCFACKDVSLDGTCKTSCSSASVQFNGYRPRLRLGHLCVKKCERPFLASSAGGQCVRECKKTEVPFNGVCIRCDPDSTASCLICSLEDRVISDALSRRLRSGGCTIWKAIRSLDFNLAMLADPASVLTLESLRIFYGRLFIKRSHRLVGDLRVLRNLQYVSDRFGVLLSRTRYLGLVNLRYAKSLLLLKLSGLCKAWYPAKRIRQLRLKFRVTESLLAFDNSSAVCRSAACDPECRDECWGPGPEMCVQCRHLRVGGRCYGSCQEAGQFFQLKNACLPCHPSCLHGCTGPHSRDCNSVNLIVGVQVCH